MSIDVLFTDRIPMSQKERDVLKTLHGVLNGERTPLDYKDRLDCLPPDRIGHTRDCRLDYSLQSVQHILYFLRSHFLAFALDDVVFPADEIKKTIRVLAKEISGVAESLAGQRSGTKPFLSGFRGFPVSTHDMRSPHKQLSCLPSLKAVAGLIFKPGICPRERDSHRTGLSVRPIGGQVKRASGLGLPVH